MSIRDELTQICETHGLHSWSSERPEGKQVQCWCGWVGSRLWDHQLDVILDRYAVVELPEPTGHWGGGPEWRDGGDVVWTALASNVMVQNVGGGDLSPHHARVLAAALLAAANRAEAQQ